MIRLDYGSQAQSLETINTFSSSQITTTQSFAKFFTTTHTPILSNSKAQKLKKAQIATLPPSNHHRPPPDLRSPPASTTDRAKRALRILVFSIAASPASIYISFSSFYSHLTWKERFHLDLLLNFKIQGFLFFSFILH